MKGKREQEKLIAFVGILFRSLKVFTLKKCIEGSQQRFFAINLLGSINTGETTNLNNLFSDTSRVNIGEQILDAYSNEIIPLTAGLNKSGKSEVYSTQVRQLVTADFIDRCFDSFYETEESVDFLPMTLFSLSENLGMQLWRSGTVQE